MGGLRHKSRPKISISRPIVEGVVPVTPITGTRSVALRKNFGNNFSASPRLAGLTQTMIKRLCKSALE